MPGFFRVDGKIQNSIMIKRPEAEGDWLMRKKEWIISLCLLCVLACVSSGLTAYVLHQNQPANIAAFENRFLNIGEMQFAASEKLEIRAAGNQLELSWSESNEALILETDVQPLPEGCRDWQLTLGIGGKQNGIKKERWGYRAQLELRMLRGESAVASEGVDLPLLAERLERTRIYTVKADASQADGWQLCIRLVPVDGALAEGSLILKNWEVQAR